MVDYTIRKQISHDCYAVSCVLQITVTIFQDCYAVDKEMPLEPAEKMKQKDLFLLVFILLAA